MGTMPPQKGMRGVPSAATWTDLELPSHWEARQTQRDKVRDTVYMWNLKKVQMNFFTEQKSPPRGRKETHGYQAGRR